MESIDTRDLVQTSVAAWVESQERLRQSRELVYQSLALLAYRTRRPVKWPVSGPDVDREWVTLPPPPPPNYTSTFPTRVVSLFTLSRDSGETAAGPLRRADSVIGLSPSTWGRTVARPLIAEHGEAIRRLLRKRGAS